MEIMAGRMIGYIKLGASNFITNLRYDLSTFSKKCFCQVDHIFFIAVIAMIIVVHIIKNFHPSSPSEVIPIIILAAVSIQKSDNIIFSNIY